MEEVDGDCRVATQLRSKWAWPEAGAAMTRRGRLGRSGKATGCLRAPEPAPRLVVLEMVLSEETEKESVDADHGLKEEGRRVMVRVQCSDTSVAIKIPTVCKFGVCTVFDLL